MRFFVGNKMSWTLTAVISAVFVSMIYPQIYTTFKPTRTAIFKPTWTAALAEEAEFVVAVNCSGHGRAFLDRVILPGQQECECNNCYRGSNCSDLDTENCIADAVTGDAMFLENYWLQEKSRSAVLIPGVHRMSYYFDPRSQKFDSPLLDYQIRSLHGSVGNANVKDKYIVFGNGVTQLLTGLVIALSQHRSTKFADMAANVVADVPYYPVFRKQTTFFRYKGYNWMGNASDYENTTEPENFIELVTSPNNPDGKLKVPRINGSVAITDRVYYWPHYTAINDIPADDDIMLFSLSKLSGHAGSRFGWAVIKDRQVYESLTQYMVESSEGTSRDTQLRALSIIRGITTWFDRSHKNSDNIFHFGYQTLRKRWRELDDLVSHSPLKRFSLQILGKKYCSYFKEYREPSPAFGWLKCEWEEEEDCEAVLKKGGIKTQGGELFEASTRYVRLSLIKTDDDFDQLMEKLTLLVNAKRN